jgi:hypothetical protein
MWVPYGTGKGLKALDRRGKPVRSAISIWDSIFIRPTMRAAKGFMGRVRTCTIWQMPTNLIGIVAPIRHAA